MRSAEEVAEVAIETLEASVPDAKQAGTNLAKAFGEGVKETEPEVKDTWNTVLDNMASDAKDWVNTIEASSAPSKAHLPTP